MHLKNLRLLQQFIIPIMIVGVFAVLATIYSAMHLHRSIDALGEVQHEGDERLRIIEENETAIVNFRALSLKHLAS